MKLTNNHNPRERERERESKLPRLIIQFIKKESHKPFFYASLFFALLLLLTVIYQLAFSWNPPTTGAPGPSGQTLYSDTNRNIGIGTLYPSVKLEIYSTSSDSILKLSRQSATSTLFKVGTDSALVINSNGADRLTISSNGNVGIGTTGPGSKLHVAGGSVTLDNGYSIIGQRTLDNAYIPILTTSGDDTLLRFMRSTVSKIFFRDTTDEDIMTLTSTGNVGIGTTNPTGTAVGGRTLHISSPSGYNSEFRLAGNGAITDMSLYTDAGWFIKDNLANAVRLSILNNGNVGIGTTAPNATLQVNGTIKILGAEEVKAFSTIYQAPTDGFVTGNLLYSGTSYSLIKGYTDSSNPPTTLVAGDSTAGSYWQDYGSISFPVRKGNYWKVENLGDTPNSYRIQWTPLGI